MRRVDAALHEAALSTHKRFTVGAVFDEAWRLAGVELVLAMEKRTISVNSWSALKGVAQVECTIGKLLVVHAF